MTHAESRQRRLKMIAMLKNGRSVYEVCKQYNVAVSTVSLARTEGGLEKANGVIADRSFKIIALLINTTRSLANIAREFNVSRERVRQIYQKCWDAGISLPRRQWGRCK